MEANARDSLRDQVVLITGENRGIGKALAGARVILTTRSQIDLDRVATAMRQQGGHSLGRAADVSRASDVRALVNAAVGRFGRIDRLINNAGVFHDNRPLYRLDEASWDQVMDVNLKGSFLCCKYVILHMRPNHSSCIINLSSDLGRGTPRWGGATESPSGPSTHSRFGWPKNCSPPVYGSIRSAPAWWRPGRRHVALFVSQLGSRSANHGQAASHRKMGEAVGGWLRTDRGAPIRPRKNCGTGISCQRIDPTRKAGPGYG